MNSQLLNSDSDKIINNCGTSGRKNIAVSSTNLANQFSTTWSFQSKNSTDVTAKATMSRAKLASLPYDIQRLIFISMSPEDKIRIFSEQIAQTISTEVLSIAEREHLLQLTRFIKPEYYSSAYSQYVETFYSDWLNFASTTLGWTEERSRIYAEMWLSKKELLAAVELSRLIHENIDPQYRPSGTNVPPCECRSDFYCGILTGNCGGECQRTGSGCGLIGTSNCIGLCTNFYGGSIGAASDR